MSYYGYRKKEKAKEPDVLLTMDEFWEDLTDLRERHKGQEEFLKAFRSGKKYIFMRMGRKGCKTTEDIEAAWITAWQKPGSVIYYCCPTITQAIEVVWDERRLQTCDRPDDDYMQQNYVKSIDNSKHIVWFKNSSHIKLIGTWNEARGRGTQPDLLIMDEVQDCDAEYLDAMHPNLAAKDGRMILSGTPPRKRNHYHEWEERIKQDPDGAAFHYSSFINDKIPHLKEWLEKERAMLIKAGKEDVWLREYMAQDCFSSADRVLPDAKFMPHEEVIKKLKIWPSHHLTPIMGTVVHNHHLTVIWAMLHQRKFLYVLDFETVNQLWDKSFSALYESMVNKIKEHSLMFDLPQKRLAGAWRKLLYDPSDSFKDVISGYASCRKDFKWQERGIPLLREKMHDSTLIFSERISSLGLECQNMLLEDKIKDVEKQYPLISTLAMIVNEYFQLEVLADSKNEPIDKYAGLREMGLCVPAPKKTSKSVFSKNW